MAHYLNSLQIYYGLKVLLLPDSKSELTIRSSEGNAAHLFIETILFSKKHDDQAWGWKIIQIKAVFLKNRLLFQGDDINRIDSIWDIKEAFRSKYPSVTDNQLDDIRIEISVNVDNLERIEIKKQLEEYSKQFILGTLSGKGNEFTFENHIVLFRKYLESKLDNVNPRNIHIQKSELTQRFIVKEYGKAEFNFRFMDILFILWSTKIIHIPKLGAAMLLSPNDHSGYDQSERIDYEANIGIQQINLLLVDGIRKFYGFEPISGTKIVLPKDQKYRYDNGTLTALFVGGGGAVIVFNKDSKKIFDTFHELWLNDQKGHYTRKEVSEAYKRVSNGEEIEQHQLSTRKAAIVKKIKEHPYFSNKIFFAFDKDLQEWSFRITI